MKTKRMKSTLDYLGEDYKPVYHDLERCLYRDFGTGFVVEISGLNSRKKVIRGKHELCKIWVWDTHQQPSRIAESIGNIYSLEELSEVLAMLCEKYGKLS